MTVYLAALLLGGLAGLRAVTPLAATAWAAGLGRLSLDGGPLAFAALPVTRWVLTAFAAAELVTDKLPITPSRKLPPSFAFRILSGAACGAAVAWNAGAWLAGAALGALGAVGGTLGGAAARGRLAAAFRRDLPVALLEDVVAVGGAALVVAGLL